MDLEFRSFNFQDRFIRHRNFLGELTTKEGPGKDFVFTLEQRGPHLVALRSVNFPDRCLRHRDFRVRLEGPAGAGDQLFSQDSTFHFEQGLADPSGVSFRSLNFPDRYLRHRDFHLFVEPKDSPNLAPDATFFRQSPPGPIDEGTALEPADQ